MLDETIPDTLEAADAALTVVSPEEDVAEQAPAVEPAAQAQPRDEEGRFASPAEAEETPPVIPTEPVESPEPRDEPTETPEPEADFPEATFAVEGQEIALPGTAVGEDGVFISPETWEQEVVPQLVAARQLSQTYRQRMSELAQREQSAQAEIQSAKAESQHVLAHFENLIERSQDAIRQNTLDALLQSPLGQWFLSVGQGWPILKAEARVKAIETQSQQATKRLEEYTQRETQERLRPLMTQAVQASIRSQGQALGLDPQTLQAVEQKLASPGYARLLFVPAPFDDPAGAFRKGETVIDHSVVAGALELVAMNRVERAQQQKIQAAVKANQTAQRKVPPTVGAKGRSPGGPSIPQPKSAKEADDLLLNGSLDWAEEVET